GVLCLGELPGVHARRADVARLAGPHDVVEGLHRLLDRGLVVPAVGLVEVDVVGPQPAQRVVDAGKDVFAGQAAVVGARAHRKEDLGGQHVVVPATERLGEQPTGDLLRQAVRVGVGGVEEGHASLHRAPHDRLGLVLAQMPSAFGLGAVAHHPRAIRETFRPDEPNRAYCTAAPQAVAFRWSPSSAGIWWSATPATTRAMPARSWPVGSWPSTAAPMIVPNIGSSPSIREKLARGSLAMASWSVT